LNRSLWAALAVSILLASGCASKKADGTAPPPVPKEAERAEHKGPVCMLERWLPTGMKYEEIDEIDVKKTWYGSTDGMLAPLADEAREVGANVVMRVRVGHSVGAIAWARPFAEGMAVWVPEMTDETCEKLKGQLL
jgi:nitrous oxide reductase accessory protein NosL